MCIRDSHGWISQKGRMGRIPRRMAQGTSHQGLPHMRHFCQLHSRLGLWRLPIRWKMGKNRHVLPMRTWAKIQGKYFLQTSYTVIVDAITSKKLLIPCVYCQLIWFTDLHEPRHEAKIRKVFRKDWRFRTSNRTTRIPTSPTHYETPSWTNGHVQHVNHLQ